MKLSTRSRYGSRAMVELAVDYPERAVSVKEMAKNERLSPKYLEQIMAALKAAGLVEAARGIHGGYRLTRPPTTIRLREIFEALEESPVLVKCILRPGTCPRETVCPTRDTWQELMEALVSVLDRTTLEDLAVRKKRKTHSPEPMYYI